MQIFSIEERKKFTNFDHFLKLETVNLSKKDTLGIKKSSRKKRVGFLEIYRPYPRSFKSSSSMASQVSSMLIFVPLAFT
jgi:hypothetical protein